MVNMWEPFTIEELADALEKMPFYEGELAWQGLMGQSENSLRDKLGTYLINNFTKRKLDHLFVPKEIPIKIKKNVNEGINYALGDFDEVEERDASVKKVLIDLAVIQKNDFFKDATLLPNFRAIIEAKSFYTTGLLYNNEINKTHKKITNDWKKNDEIVQYIFDKSTNQVPQYGVLFIFDYTIDGYDPTNVNEMWTYSTVIRYLHDPTGGLFEKLKKLESFRGITTDGKDKLLVSIEKKLQNTFIGHKIRCGHLENGNEQFYRYFKVKGYFAIIQR